MIFSDLIIDFVVNFDFILTFDLGANGLYLIPFKYQKVQKNDHFEQILCFFFGLDLLNINSICLYK
ncbi:hypothetical protein DR864_25940 [Runella rosea]|uniref:Uncharacterized protein n=1 Tax=Runella rosea TaxID=2259595 RepID=A0A344TQL5_9BACT|nr:hypothetical protein DR864_25940 [Runella rosea]